MTKTANSGTYTLVYSAKDGLWHSSQTSPPAQVPALSVTGVSTSTVNLSWGVPAAGSYPITGYNIYRNGVVDGFVSVPNTTDQDSGLSSPVTYTYNVAAVDTSGQVGPQSSSVTATTLFYTSPPAGALTGGTTGILYSAQITANGGIAPVTAAITAQSGNTYTISTTGQVATLACANPTIVGTDSVTVQFTDTMNNKTVPVTYTIAIAQAAAGFGKYDGTIKVAINAQGQGILVNSTGVQIQPRGANMSALQFVPIQIGSGDRTGTTPFATAPFPWQSYALWKPNIVRIPINEASWLDLTNVYTTTGGNCASEAGKGGGNWKGGPYLADPFRGTSQNYKQTLVDCVAQAQAAGCYVIFDIHMVAITLTIQGVSHVMAIGEQPMFTSDFTIAAWATGKGADANGPASLSLAQVFGNNITCPITSTYGPVNNKGILFEINNEPVMTFLGASNSTAIMSSSGSTVPLCNAGSSPFYSTAVPFYRMSTSGAGFYGPNAAPAIPGWQAVVNAIRAQGASNVCIIGSEFYSANPCLYASNFPTDNLAVTGTSQLALSWHSYADVFPFPALGGGQPYFGNGGSSIPNTNNTANCFQGIVQGPIAAGIPVIMTEFGGYANSWLYNQDDPTIAFLVTQFDKYGVGGCGFQFNLISGGPSFVGNISTTGVVTVTSNPHGIYFSYGNNNGQGQNYFTPGLPTPTSPAQYFGNYVVNSGDLTSQTSFTLNNGGGTPPISLGAPLTGVTIYVGNGTKGSANGGQGLLGGANDTQLTYTPCYGSWATLYKWMVNHA